MATKINNTSLFWLILLVGFIVRVIGLNQSFWLDEAAQVIESARPLSEQLTIEGDFQPPLYHLLLHFWMLGGRSEIWIRSLSVFLGLGTLYGIYLVAKQMSHERVALLTMFFLSVAPFHVWYSQEARPYAFAALIGIFSLYFLLSKNWLNYTVTVILAFYTFYLLPFFVLTHGVYIYLFQKKYMVSWFKSLIVGVLAFLPWVPYFLKQLTIGTSLTTTLPGWGDAVSTPLVKALPLVFAKFVLGRITIDDDFVYGIVVISLFVGFVFVVWQVLQKNKSVVSSLVLFTGLPVGLAFLTSVFVPVLAPQRVLFVLPLFFLLIAYCLDHLKQKWIGVAILTVISLYSLVLYVTEPRFQREQWRQAVSYIEENRTATSVVVFVFPDAFAPWQWYSRGVVPDVAVAPTFTVKRTELEQFRMRLMQSDRIFYFQYLTDLTDPQKQTVTFLEEIGFGLTQTVDFPGVGFIHIYEKALAHR